MHLRTTRFYVKTFLRLFAASEAACSLYCCVQAHYSLSFFSLPALWSKIWSISDVDERIVPCVNTENLPLLKILSVT